MPFEAHILQYLEDALSECFEYHRALDNFVIRSGVPKSILDSAREIAEQQIRDSSSDYSRAPKRFVVQALLTILTSKGERGEYALSSLITSVTKGKFRDATEVAKKAIENLSNQVEDDKQQKVKEKEKKRKNGRD